MGKRSKTGLVAAALATMLLSACAAGEGDGFGLVVAKSPGEATPQIQQARPTGSTGPATPRSKWAGTPSPTAHPTRSRTAGKPAGGGRPPAARPAGADEQELLPAPAVPVAGTDPAAPLRVQYAPGWGEQHSYLAWVPPASDRTRQAVLIIHGGGWVRGTERGMSRYARRLQAEGIAAFSTAYRLADRDDPTTAWPAQRDDVRAALHHIAAHADAYGIDRNRISVIGSSAGGQLATLLATNPGADRVRAAVAFSPPLDLDQAATADASKGDRWLSGVVRYDLMQCSRLSADAECQRRWESARLPGPGQARLAAPVLLFYQRDEWVSARYGYGFQERMRELAPRVPVEVDVAEGDKHADRYVLDTEQGQPERVWWLAEQWIQQHG